MVKVIEQFPNYTISDSGEVYNIKKQMIMKQHLDKDGYCVLNLSDYGNKFQVRVHRLVAQAFIPNPHNLATVNHINHIKTDNRVANLEWMSNEDNAKDGWNGKIMPKGEKHPASKLTQQQADQIRIDVANGISRKVLAEQYNVTTATIGNIINNKVYKRD